MALNIDDREAFLPVGDGPTLRAPPRLVVRIAAVGIIAMGALGLVRGIMLSRPVSPDASPLSALTGLNPSANNAKPATLLPRDDSWSALSGPQMADSSAKPKAAAKAAASDETDDSESPAAQTAAADAIAPDAPDAAPAAPAASSNAAPTGPASPPQTQAGPPSPPPI